MFNDTRSHTTGMYAPYTLTKLSNERVSMNVLTFLETHEFKISLNS